MAADQVFLDDALEVFGSAGVIPDDIGINDGDGATDADPEAVGFGPVDEGLGAAEPELGEAFFEKLPCGHAVVEGAAFCHGGGGAEEDVLLVAVEVEGLSGGFEEVGHDDYLAICGAVGGVSFSR